MTLKTILEVHEAEVSNLTSEEEKKKKDCIHYHLLSSKNPKDTDAQFVSTVVS